MNKLIRLSHTGIEYGDYAWNFASGCGNQVEGRCKGGGFNCWAHSTTQRFGDHYPNGFKPTVYPDAFCSPIHLKKPSRILCAFMGDLFWDCPEFDPNEKIEALMPSRRASVSMSLKGWIYTTIKMCPQHTFIFLTKQPQNLIKFSPFPDNVWLGESITSSKEHIMHHLADVKASIKFISYEPLLYWDMNVDASILSQAFRVAGISWVIIGAQTKPYKPPKIEWVQEIIEACDKAGVKVFLKNNLEDMLFWHDAVWAFDNDGVLRQEIP